MGSRVKEIERMCNEINENGGLDDTGWMSAMLTQIALNLATIADVMAGRKDELQPDCAWRPPDADR